MIPADCIEKNLDKKCLEKIYNDFDILMQANDHVKLLADKWPSSLTIKDLQKATIAINMFYDVCRQFVESLEAAKIIEIDIRDHPVFPLLMKGEGEALRKDPFGIDILRIKCDQLRQTLEDLKNLNSKPNSKTKKLKTMWIYKDNGELDRDKTMIGGIRAKDYEYNLAEIANRDTEKLGPFIDDPEVAQALLIKINQEMSQMPIYRILAMQRKVTAHRISETSRRDRHEQYPKGGTGF